MDEIYLKQLLSRSKWIDAANYKPLPTMQKQMAATVYEHRPNDDVDWRINFVNQTSRHPTIYPTGLRGAPTPRNMTQAILQGS